MRTFSEPRHALQYIVRHSECTELDRSAAAVEETEHDTFAKHGWHRRDAKIQLSLLESYSNAAILWPTAFGDIEFRQEFDARDNRMV
jgi:hypothetical protein